MSLFLWTGIILVFIHLENIHLLHYYWKGYVEVLRLTLRTILTCVWDSITAISFVSIPWTNELNNSISVNINVGKSSYSSMVWLLERELSFIIGLHCPLKKSLNRFALTRKSVLNSLFTRRGGINGIFEPLTNVFKIDQ